MAQKPMSHVPSVSQDVLAQIFGVDRRTVSRWIRAGLPAGKKGRELSIDLAVAVQWVRTRDAESTEARIAAVRANPDLEAVRARKLTAEARIAEANAAAREGELLSASEVRHRWTSRILAARERLLTLSPVAVQAGLIQPAHERELQRLVNEALSELSTA
jgi:phage terminase Nu1 subunit (DNA packaging protein)